VLTPKLHLQRPQSRGSCASRSRAGRLAAPGRRYRHHRRARRLFRHTGRLRPGPGFHAGGVLSEPGAGSARPVKRYEGRAGAGRHGANHAATSEVTRTPLPPATIAPKPVPRVTPTSARRRLQ